MLTRIDLNSTRILWATDKRIKRFIFKSSLKLESNLYFCGMPRLTILAFCKSLTPGVEAPGNFSLLSVAAYKMGVSPRHFPKLIVSNLKQNREAVEIIPSMSHPSFYTVNISSGNS